MDHVAYIGLGSNIEPRARTLLSALKMLHEREGVTVVRMSQLIQTEPVGGPADQPAFLNAAAELRTSLSPAELLAAMHETEAACGRDRSREQRWGPRTCDLDLLMYDDLVSETDPTLPHPLMHQRAFVLKPLAEIAPNLVHPVLGKTVAELLAWVGGTGAAGGQREGETAGDRLPAASAPVRPPPPTEGARLVSVIGPPASGKTSVACRAADELSGRLMMEDYAGNPFLAAAYAGDAEAALASQLYFLFSRLGQLNRQAWPARGVVVTDYGFCQDAVYASICLSEADLALYRRLAGPAGEAVKPPDVVVHLDGPEELLLRRIAERGRAHEQGFTGEFLATMRQAYRELAPALGCAVIDVDVAEVDLRRPEAEAVLMEKIRAALA